MIINWDVFYIFTIVSVILWIISAFASAAKDGISKTAVTASIAGSIVFMSFIAGLWMYLQRPPLRTMGETRLWYSLFMGISGLITYWRWKYRWILSFSTLVSSVFCIINILKPGIHDQSLMPALQSVWFIPHVTVYMFSYSVLGCAFIIGCIGMKKQKEVYTTTADELVYTGTAFLTIGMLTGAIWAKDAWGNYWSWDPKETWAAITWTIYLIYIHIRLQRTYKSKKLLYGLLIAGFISLQMCWYGVNYLPAAQKSVHLYNRQ